MEDKKIMVVAGTRPEWIKLVSFINEAENEGLNIIIVNTGQHLDMSKEVLDMFGLIPDYELKIMEHKQSLTKILKNVINKLTPVVEEVNPDCIVVLGDTNTGIGAGMVAFYNQIPLVHLEGGARSFNKKDPFPEEMNRRLLDNLADINTCQTEQDKKYLELENIYNGHVVGNYSLDIVRRLSDSFQEQKKILITMHRREGWGEKQKEACEAIKELAIQYENYKFVLPLHPNPTVQDNIRSVLSDISNVKLIPALNFIEFINELKTSEIVMTDSGGILQETLFLGKPVIYLRNECEYKDLCPKSHFVITGKNKQKIIEETKNFLDKDLPEIDTTIFGNGNAGKETVKCIKTYLGE